MCVCVCECVCVCMCVGGAVSAVQSALTDVLYITCHFIPLEYWGVAKLKPARYSNPSPAQLRRRRWWSGRWVVRRMGWGGIRISSRRL